MQTWKIVVSIEWHSFGYEDGFMMAAAVTGFDGSPDDITDLSIGVYAYQASAAPIADHRAAVYQHDAVDQKR